MKNFHFIIQAKGGCGKSMYTYLQALKNENNQRSYFVDTDSSVKTSSTQLKFLYGKSPQRFGTMNLLDDRDRLDRQLLFQNLLELSQMDYDDFYLDFGAPESDQLPSLLSKDYTIDEFKQIQDELNAHFTLHVIIAGGGAYTACTNFLQKIVTIVRGILEINVLVNQSTLNHSYLLDEITTFIKDKKNGINSLKVFGDFDITTAPHKKILSYIEQGRGMDAYVFIEKIKIIKELNKI